MFQHGAARHTDASRAATTRPSRSPAPAFARLPHQLRSPRPPDLTRQSTPTSLTAWLLAGRSPDTWHLLGSSSGSNLLTTQTCTQSHVLTSPRAPRHHVNPTRPWFSPALPPLPRPLHSKSPFASPLLSLPITVSTLPLLHPTASPSDLVTSPHHIAPHSRSYSALCS